jgi:hypothetical protein
VERRGRSAGGDERFLGYISADVGGTGPGEYGSYGWNDRSNDDFLAGYFIEYAAPTLAVPAPGVPALLLGGLLAAFAADPPCCEMRRFSTRKDSRSGKSCVSQRV